MGFPPITISIHQNPANMDVMKANRFPLLPGPVLAAVAARTLVMLAALVATLNVTDAGPRGKSSLSREPGAIYLEDFVEKPVKLRVKADVSPPIFSRLDAKTRLGKMVPGTTVTIDAVSEKAYRVRGKATHGGVVGWMSPKYLEATDPEFFAKMTQTYERYLKVQELIEAKEVGLGMTVAEVEQSLGRATNSKSSIDKDGTHLTLEYITYDRVPQIVTRRNIYGGLYNTTVYVKIPVGKLAVHFSAGVVSRIEEEIGEAPAGGVKIVPAPIDLF